MEGTLAGLEVALAAGLMVAESSVVGAVVVEAKAAAALEGEVKVVVASGTVAVPEGAVKVPELPGQSKQWWVCPEASRGYR